VRARLNALQQAVQSGRKKQHIPQDTHFEELRTEKGRNHDKGGDLMGGDQGILLEIKAAIIRIEFSTTLN